MIQQARVDARHDGTQPTLAFKQWPTAQIFTINREHIERDEVRSVAAEQQPIEQRAPIGREAHNLAVEDSGMRTDAVRDFY